MADSYAQQLREAKKEIASLREQVERLEPLEAELLDEREKAAKLEEQLAEGFGKGNVEFLRRDNARLTTEHAELEKRLVITQRNSQLLMNTLDRVRQMVAGKECILPQIRELLRGI